jgi:hypothetical protein
VCWLRLDGEAVLNALECADGAVRKPIGYSCRSHGSPRKWTASRRSGSMHWWGRFHVGSRVFFRVRGEDSTVTTRPRSPPMTCSGETAPELILQAIEDDLEAPWERFRWIAGDLRGNRVQSTRQSSAPARGSEPPAFGMAMRAGHNGRVLPGREKGWSLSVCCSPRIWIRS